MTPFDNHANRIRRFLLVFVIVLFSIMSIGCGSLGQCTNPDVHFILPNGYVGSFRIVLDEAHGVVTKLEQSKYVYVIPTDGELRVKTFDPFLGCHKENAAYQNGQQIPDANSDTPSDAIALRGGVGSGSRPVDGKNVGPIILTYVIGSLEEEKRMKLPTFSEEVPQATSSPRP